MTHRIFVQMLVLSSPSLRPNAGVVLLHHLAPHGVGAVIASPYTPIVLHTHRAPRRAAGSDSGGGSVTPGGGSGVPGGGGGGSGGFGLAKDANTGRVLRGDEMAAEASPWQVGRRWILKSDIRCAFPRSFLHASMLRLKRD